MDLGINVFSIRKLLIEKRTDVWASLKRLGLGHVELMMLRKESLPDPGEISEEMKPMLESFRKFVVPFSESEPTIREIRGQGLAVDCVHVAVTNKDWADLNPLSESLISFSKETGVRNFVIGINNHLDQFRELAPAIGRMATMMKKHDIRLIYHNHDKECAPFAESTYFEHLISHYPDLWIEVDVGWLYYANIEVLPFLVRYSDRLAFIHLKDLMVERGLPAFQPIGYGNVPIEAVLRFAKDHGFQDQLIIDQDDSPDILADLQKGLAFIRNHLSSSLE